MDKHISDVSKWTNDYYGYVLKWAAAIQTIHLVLMHYFRCYNRNSWPYPRLQNTIG